MDDKRFNVWCIKNKDGNFYHEVYKNAGRTSTGRVRMVFDKFEWTDKFNSASFYNYSGAERKMNGINEKGLSIIGYEEYENSLKQNGKNRV